MTTEPNRLTPREALDAIFTALDGEEWSADTLDAIGQVIKRAGYRIGAPGKTGSRPEPAPMPRLTVPYYLGAHLTFHVEPLTTRVVRLEIMPYQEDPICEEWPEGITENEREELDQAMFDQGWSFPALGQLPDGITWEV